MKAFTIFFALLIGSAVAAKGLDSDDLSTLPKPAVRIPAILHFWKEPTEDQKVRTMSIEEISRCMGRELNLESQVNGLKQRNAELETEHAQLEQETIALEASRRTLDARIRELDEFSEARKRSSAELQQRRSALERNAKNPLTEHESKELNASATKFNLSVQEHNKRTMSLRKDTEEFQKSVNAYNERSYALDQKVQHFNERNTTFSKVANRFNDEAKRYADKCTGERLVRK